MPNIYVLMRLYNKDISKPEVFLSSIAPTLKSVANNFKDYKIRGGNAFLIINDDTLNSNSERYKTYISLRNRLLESIVGVFFDTKSPGGEGSSMATYRIRSFFLYKLPSSRQDDIAVSLDQDDLLAEQALYSISKGMAGKDIAISKFEIRDSNNLDITDDGGKRHNKLVGKLARNTDIVSLGSNIALLSTLGWSKSYSRRIMEIYFSNLTSVLKKTGGAEKFFKNITAYEDFIDLYPLLIEGVRIGGTKRKTHIYVKHADSITSSPKIKDFREYRTATIMALIDLCYAHRSNTEGHKFTRLRADYKPILLRFVAYKVSQIESIINDKYNYEYAHTNNPLYKEFASKTYNGYFIDILCRKGENNVNFKDLFKLENATYLKKQSPSFFVYDNLNEKLSILTVSEKEKKRKLFGLCRKRQEAKDELKSLIGEKNTPSQKRYLRTLFLTIFMAIVLVVLILAMFGLLSGRIRDIIRELPSNSFIYAVLVAIISLLVTELLKLHQLANNEVSFRKLYYSEFLDLVRHLEANLKVMIQIRKELKEGKTKPQNIHFKNLKWPPESSLFSDDIINIIEKERVDDFSRLKLNIRNINNSAEWLNELAQNNNLKLEHLEWEITRNMAYFVNFRYMVTHEFSFPSQKELDIYIDTMGHSLDSLFMDYPEQEKENQKNYFIERYKTDRRVKRKVLLD